MIKWLERVFLPGIGKLATHAPSGAPRVDNAGHRQTLAGHYPRISVVMPSFNQAGYIEASILSVLEQDYPNLEFIVMDGGSTDGTRAILEKYAGRVTYWVSEPDGGQADAINKGFARSSGEIMAWLNSDDCLCPGALRIIAACFDAHPEADVVYGDRILIDHAGAEVGRWVLPDDVGYVLKWADFIPQETLYWRRSAWNAVGARVDSTFAFAMDWDLLLRFRAAGRRMRHIPAYLGMFRVHPEQKTSKVMQDTGFAEIGRLRERELGFRPARWQVVLYTLPYLLMARWAELKKRLRVDG